MIFFSRTTGPTNIITKMKDKKRATPSPSRDHSKYENFLNWPDFSQTWHKAFKSSTLLEEIITGNFESSPEPLIQFRPKLNPMLSKVKFVRLTGNSPQHRKFFPRTKVLVHFLNLVYSKVSNVAYITLIFIFPQFRFLTLIFSSYFFLLLKFRALILL